MYLAHQARKLYWRAFRPTTLGSRCLIVSGTSLLLVKHTYERWYYLPGGGVRRGESFADAARREVREETCLNVASLRLLHLYHNRGEGKSDHVALYLAESFSGAPRAGCHEIEEVGYYPLDALPELTSPATRRRVGEYLRGSYPDTW